MKAARGIFPRRGIKYSTKSRSYGRRNYRTRDRTYLTRRTKELKWNDEQQTAAGGDAIIRAGGTVYCLNHMVQGNDVNQRDGRQITMKSIDLRCFVSVSVGYTRLLLVYDKQTNGVAPDLDDVINQIGAAGDGYLKGHIAPRQLNNRERFTILWDKLIASVTGEIVQNSKDDPTNFPSYYKACSLSTTFGGNAGDVTDILTGGLFLLAFSNLDAGSNPPALMFNSRVRFYD